MIRFENVTKVYDQTARPALDAVNLEIDRGEFAFLVGASGSGKSTFLRLVLKEDRASSGAVYVAGQNVAKISSWRVPRLRRGIGVVFQDFRLLPQKNVFANVAFAMQVIGQSRSVIRDTVPEVLKTVGLEGKEHRMPHELSGGEQQRVAIARAVVNRPGILLADEPTGNLDPTTSMGIMGILDKINQNGTTVVMATHDDDIVNEMRKRVVELKNGVVIRDEAKALYTSMIPVVGQSRRLKDASGRETARTRRPGKRGTAMRLAFILSEIGSGLRRNVSMVVSVILVTFVSLTFVGAAGMLQMQINQMKGYWYDKVQVAVFLCSDGSTAASCAGGPVTPEQQDSLNTLLESPAVGQYINDFAFESKEEAYDHFKNQFSNSPIVDSVTPDQLPASFRINMKDPEKYQIISETFSSQAGVETVIDQRQLLERLFSVMNGASLVAVSIAGVMIVCAILLIATTIRLSAFSRRRETGIMRLVGASKTVIQLPFILEGVIAAVIGAALASATLWAVARFFLGDFMAQQYPDTAFISAGQTLILAPALLLLGACLAGISSLLTLRRYLRV